MGVRDVFSRLTTTRERGDSAERHAAAWLCRQGMVPVAAQQRIGGGEIDLILRDGDTLCFVEVKARSRRDFGGAVAAVTADKRRRVRDAAALYCQRERWKGPCRFDVVTLDRERGEWRVRHYRNAF